MTSTAVPRLAIVRQKYNPAGGAERFVSRAIGALQEAGQLEVALIARRWEPLDGVKTYRVAPFYLGNVWRDAGFALQARALWRRQAFDLVQSHERIPGCSIYRAGDGVHAEWLALRRRTLSWCGRVALWLNPYHHYVLGAERRMFLHPDLRLIICNSHMVKHEIMSKFGVPEKRIAVIYNGVDTTAFHPGLAATHRAGMREALAIPPDAPVLLYVGSGFERKGVARALAAVCHEADVHLVVVGGDKHAGRYRALAEKLGIAERVHFVGPKNDVKPYYGMADGFILPTLYDPFPNVCVEALASGLPLLTTTTCGASEMVQEDINGWVVDPFDASALSAAVSRWRHADYDSLRRAARKSVESMTLDRMAETLKECYRQLLA